MSRMRGISVAELLLEDIDWQHSRLRRQHRQEIQMADLPAVADEDGLKAGIRVVMLLDFHFT